MEVRAGIEPTYEALQYSPVLFPDYPETPIMPENRAIRVNFDGAGQGRGSRNVP
jgi:hypothetical protein